MTICIKGPFSITQKGISSASNTADELHSINLEANRLTHSTATLCIAASQGVSYFRCEENRGIFVIPRKITVLGVTASRETVEGTGSLRRRVSTQDTTAWETESVTSQFSFISVATVQSLGSDLDDAAQTGGKQSPRLCSAAQSDHDFVILPSAASC